MPRKQKRRKTGVILSFFIPIGLLGQVDEAVQERNKNTRGVHFNRSEWIRRAIVRDLAHRDRSRSKRVSTVPITAEQGVEDLGSPPASLGSIQGPAPPNPAPSAGVPDAVSPGAVGV